VDGRPTQYERNRWSTLMVYRLSDKTNSGVLRVRR